MLASTIQVMMTSLVDLDSLDSLALIGGTTKNCGKEEIKCLSQLFVTNFTVVCLSLNSETTRLLFQSFPIFLGGSSIQYLPNMQL